MSAVPHICSARDRIRFSTSMPSKVTSRDTRFYANNIGRPSLGRCKANHKLSPYELTTNYPTTYLSN